MSIGDLSQALEAEEHIFILEWGDECARLLYAFLEDGEITCIDGFSQPSQAVQNGTPIDDELAAITIHQLVDECQSKYHLQIQTLFVLIKSGGKLAYRVPDIKPYLAFLEKERQGHIPFSSAHLHGIPHHCDLFDAFDSESEAFRYAFALPSTMREKIQHILIKSNIFAEGFISLPRIGVKSRELLHPGLVLGIFPENSIVMASKGDDLAFYREFPFCLNMAVDKVQHRLNVPKERARRMLNWVTRTPNIEEFDQGHPEDQALYLSKDFTLIKNDIAEELDKLTISIREDMENCGAWDLGFDHLYLLGEGQAFYHHFTFLRDNLPFEPMPLPIPHQKAIVKGLNQEEFAPLIRLILYCQQLRSGHRTALTREKPMARLKKWAHRLFAH